MTRKALIEKSKRQNKFKTRNYNRCFECGRSHSVFSKYLLCRIHMREYINEGKITGFKKASW